MTPEVFFENYVKIEHIWEEFMNNEVSYKNSSALGMTAIRICHYVVQNPGCALKEIALSLDISLGSASQMVQAMTIGGLLKCTQNKDDRRRISISPLPVIIDFFANMAKML